MARSVADVVLVRGDFAAVPAMVGEGRQILRNVQRVARLFVTKSVFAVVLIVSLGLTTAAYPLLPRQLTLAGTVVVGIPAFLLTLAPSSGRYQIEGFLQAVARFAVPAGLAVGTGVVTAYVSARGLLAVPTAEARTVATTVLVGLGLLVVCRLEAPLRGQRGTAVAALTLALAGLYSLALLVPLTRAFFALTLPGASGLVAIAAGSALGATALVLNSRQPAR